TPRNRQDHGAAIVHGPRSARHGLSRRVSKRRLPTIGETNGGPGRWLVLHPRRAQALLDLPNPRIPKIRSPYRTGACGPLRLETGSLRAVRQVIGHTSGSSSQGLRGAGIEPALEARSVSPATHAGGHG